jgi:DNA mismatch repair protein MutL
MSKVQLMPDALASQVAAGEVVERPSSVVKELVENALDAGARSVEVLVQRGGIALIRVIDDGEGMNREDALLAMERHATSKLKTKEDLGNILTLGFRGEALPSIASVSKFRLSTREKDALCGTEIVIEGGKLIDVKDSGEAPGTQMEVRGLFYNMPARRKFLRTETTEFSHVEQMVRVQAIAHPNIGFTLRHGDRTVFQLPAGQSLRERIAGLTGSSVVTHLIEIPQTKRGGITVHGYVSEPGFGRSNRAMVHTFLNRRPVESLNILYALKEAYRTALITGQHPVTFLFIDIDPQAVDVNVHPAKKEVRFHDGRGVQRVLTEILQETLTPKPREARVYLPPPMRPVEERCIDDEVIAIVRPKPLAAAPRQSEFSEPEPEPEPEPEQADEVEFVPKPVPASKPVAFEIKGVLRSGYVLLESDDGLVLMDPKASHERVLYEEARRRIEQGDAASQRLLMPLMVDLTPRDMDFVRKYIETFSKLGVVAEEFGGNTLKVDALPPFCAESDGVRFIHNVIDELRENAVSTGSDAVAATVCHQAVSLRAPLHEKELAALVRDLMACAMPYCDPRGKATLVQMAYSEIDRKFGKK